MRSNLADVDVRLHHETKGAYLVSTDGNRDNAVWVPKSACELEMKGRDGRVGVLTLEQDLAEEKGLV